MNANTYAVTEKSYSWGTHVKLYRDNMLVMFADVYNNGTYSTYSV